MNAVAEAVTGWNEVDARGELLLTVFVILNDESRQPAENPAPRVLRGGTVADPANPTILVSA
jgi:hypothetical protein